MGIGENKDICGIVEQTLLSDTSVTAFSEKENLPLEGQRLLTTPEYWAYLKIAEGCSTIVHIAPYRVYAESSAAVIWRVSLKKRGLWLRME